MLRLIKNEYAKIFLKKSTYVILGICLLTCIGISALVQFANDSMDEYYYEETSLKEELQWYDENSQYINDRVYRVMCSTYIDMGYEYYSEIPSWVMLGVDNVLFNHYVYELISEAENVEAAEMETGKSLEGIDVEYEKKITEDMLTAIKAGNYTEYYNLCLSYIGYQKANKMMYSQEDYEYYTYLVEKEINPVEDEDRMDVLSTYIYAKVEYESLLMAKEQGENVSDYELEKYKKAYTIYQYILDNNIEYYLTEPIEEGDSTWSQNKFITALTNNVMAAGMAGIFVMIIAAGIIANEFSNGTIKFLLINPVKRAKIFWSKYSTCISLLLSSMVVFYVIYFVFCMIMCGTDGMGGSYIYYDDGVAYEQSIIMYSLEQYALSGVSLIISVSLAFTISALLRSTAIAIALSLVIEFLGATITVFLYGFGHDWARFLIFANTDLASISKGTSMFPGQTVGFALTVIVVYMTIFLLTAYDAFKKKDV